MVIKINEQFRFRTKVNGGCRIGSGVLGGITGVIALCSGPLGIIVALGIAAAESSVEGLGYRVFNFC